MRVSNSCLEIRCGSGVWTSLFIEKFPNVTVLDISEEMLTQTKNKFDKKIKEYLCGDFLDDNLIFKDGYDHIFLIRAFEYFNNKEDTVKKLFEIKLR